MITFLMLHVKSDKVDTLFPASSAEKAQEEIRKSWEACEGIVFDGTFVTHSGGGYCQFRADAPIDFWRAKNKVAPDFPKNCIVQI